MASHNTIGSVDLNNSPPTEVPVSAESQPAPELNGVQVATQGASNGLDTTNGHQQLGRGQSEHLPSLGELLHGAGSTLSLASADSKEMCLRERSASDSGYIVKNDRNEALQPGLRRGASKDTPILLDNPLEEKAAQDARRHADSSQVYDNDGATLEEYKGTQCGERGGEEGTRCTPPASASDIGCSILNEENALPALSDPPLNTNDLLPPMSGNSNSASSGDGLRNSSPDPLTRKNKDAVQTDDRTEEKESNTEPTLAPSRERSEGPASGRADTRHEPAETQTSGHTAASGRNAKRGRQALCSGNSNVIPRTDHYDADTDAGDDDDFLHLLKKQRTKVAAHLGRRTQAPKFRYPPGWEKDTASDRSEAGGSQAKPFVVQDEEPDPPNEKTPPQKHSITLKADHADTLAVGPPNKPSQKQATNYQPAPIAPLSRPKPAKDHQPRPVAPLPRPKPASGQGKTAHVKGQQWEIKKIAGKRWTKRGWEYKVVWASSWLPRSELGNARRLLRKFELKDSTEQKSRRDRLAREDSSSGS